MLKTATFAYAAAASMVLQACGTYVPTIHENWEEAGINDTLIIKIKRSIYCEMRQAVHSINTGEFDPGQIGDNLIPANYGAQLTLTLQVDETGAANPGATISRSLGGGGLFSLGLGATLSSQSTRIDKYYSFFSTQSLKLPFGSFDSSCGEPQFDGTTKPFDRSGSSFLLSGKLGIRDWLYSAVRQQLIIPSDKFPKASNGKVDVLSYQVKFNVITTGTINPVFKLVNISSESGQAVFSGNRTRSHDFLLTLGPDVENVVSIDGNKRRRVVASPGDAAANLHFSSEIGSSISRAIRNGTAFGP